MACMTIISTTQCLVFSHMTTRMEAFPVHGDPRTEVLYHYKNTLSTKTVCKDSSTGDDVPPPTIPSTITTEGGSPIQSTCKTKMTVVSHGSVAAQPCPGSSFKLCGKGCSVPMKADSTGGASQSDRGDANATKTTCNDFVAPQEPNTGVSDWCGRHESKGCEGGAYGQDLHFGRSQHAGGPTLPHGDPGATSPESCAEKNPVVCARWLSPGTGFNGGPAADLAAPTLNGGSPSPPAEIANDGCTEAWDACNKEAQQAIEDFESEKPYPPPVP